jgi:hypothetical protein
MDCSSSGRGQMASTCECGDELSGYIKCGEFSWLVEERLYSEERICSKELVG